MSNDLSAAGAASPSMRQFSLEGKVILVTGATGVLGEAFVRTIAEAGGTVVLLGRNAAVAKERTDLLISQGMKAGYHVCDVLNQEALEAVAEKVLSEYGAIHGLVNGAGGNKPGAVIMPAQDLFSLDVPALQDVFNLNLFGTVLPSMVFGKHIAAAGGGSIVNISSIAAQQVLTRVLGYSLAKGAVDNFTRWMSVELALRKYNNTRVNAIAPGFFLAEQNRKLLLNDDGSLTPRGQAVISNTPYGRFGNPNELTGALVWLLSDASAFVTGEIIRVDGGFGAWSGV